QAAAQARLFHRDIIRDHRFLDRFLVLNLSMRRPRCTFLPNNLNKFRTLLAQDALYTSNGVALAVQKMTYAAQQIDIGGAIIAATATTLHRLYFVKAALPKAQHVLRQIEFVCHFTDSAKRV